MPRLETININTLILITGLKQHCYYLRAQSCLILFMPKYETEVTPCSGVIGSQIHVLKFHPHCSGGKR
jgi:hypothetical protein